MGYSISMIGGEFFLPAPFVHDALVAARALKARETELTDTWGFAWMRDSRWYEAGTLQELLREWRYVPTTDEAGNITDLEFEGEKLGDELHLFRAIAPYVRPGSYLEIAGEEGERWRWLFDGGTCVEQHAKGVYE